MAMAVAVAVAMAVAMAGVAKPPIWVISCEKLLTIIGHILAKSGPQGRPRGVKKSTTTTMSNICRMAMTVAVAMTVAMAVHMAMAMGHGPWAMLTAMGMAISMGMAVTFETDHRKHESPENGS